MEPEQIELIDEVKAAYQALQDAKAEQTIKILRLRADVAVAIHNAHGAGISNYRIAKELDTDRTTVGRLQAGMWVPPGQPVPLTAPTAPSERLRATPGPQVPGERIPRALTVCRYCSAQASHAIRFPDGKTHFVCEKHKPKGRYVKT